MIEVHSYSTTSAMRSSIDSCTLCLTHPQPVLTALPPHDNFEKPWPWLFMNSRNDFEWRRDTSASLCSSTSAPTQHSQTSQTPDPFLVNWQNEHDRTNPKNWTRPEKWTATLILSLFAFVTMMTSTMVSPALQHIARDLHIQSEAETQLVLSAYVLAYAFGPFIWAPLSEIWGRKIVLQSATLWFLIWNLGCGFARNKITMIVSRLFSGIGGSAALALSAGVLGDAWKQEERGRSLAVYSLFPLLGPCIGPIIGGYVTQHTSWRVLFWSITLLSTLLQFLALLFLRETYPPLILHHKTLALRHLTHNQSYHSALPFHSTTLPRTLTLAFKRPFHLLLTQPHLQLITLYTSLSFGVLYIVLSTMPTLFTSPNLYHQSPSRAGLNYLSIGLGFTLGAQPAASLMDTIQRRYSFFNGRTAQPETRLLLFLPALTLSATGLLLYGWSAQHHLHILIPNIGITLYGAGVQMSNQAINAYVIDTYHAAGWSASAAAGVWAVKSGVGFGMPLLGPALYRALGWGGGDSLLAGGLVVVGGLAWAVLFVCGGRLRQRGLERL